MNSTWTPRRFGVAPTTADAILQTITALSGGKVDWIRLARSVRELSDHFNANAGPTPWATPQTTAAYLAYFLPLNIARVTAVLFEWRSLNLAIPQKVVDIGSGPGTIHLAARSVWPTVPSWLNWEIADRASAVHRQLVGHEEGDGVSWTAREPGLDGGAVFASYSLNEMKDWPRHFLNADQVMIVEPATQESSRRLMAYRDALIRAGFHLWAPCTHQKACPLLTHSRHDWCHDRIHFDPPPWWNELSRSLPMHNDTLTYSYLIAARSAPAWINGTDRRARVIGDTLFEKGKVRQAVCRGEKREFLSWLTRSGPPEQIPHGALLTLPATLIEKGNELRSLSPLTGPKLEP